jgi:3-methyladenine DNA glycosylase AlkD
MRRLRAHRGTPEDVEGMARFGIRSAKVLGINVPTIRRLSREIGPNHGIALELWASGVFEARLLAAMVDEPSRVTPQQMDRWAAG